MDIHVIGKTRLGAGLFASATAVLRFRQIKESTTTKHISVCRWVGHRWADCHKVVSRAIARYSLAGGDRLERDAFAVSRAGLNGGSPFSAGLYRPQLLANAEAYLDELRRAGAVIRADIE